MSTLSTSNSFKVSSSVLEQGTVDNLNRLGIPSARKLEATTKIDYSGSEGLLKTSLSLTRATDPLLENAQRKQITNLEEANTLTSYLRSMQSSLLGSDNSQESILVKSIDEFFAQAKILEANSSTAMRQAFIGKAEILAQRLTNITSK
jgi:hypothetical protein